MESFLREPPAQLGETFEEFLATNNLWEHDLRHGLRSADMNPYLVEIRELAHDPHSKVDILVEQGFKLSPVFLGYIDLIVTDRRDGKLKVSIHDHKFMANKRSVLSEEEARSDYQTLVYAKSVLTFFRLDTVTFSYDYYGSKYRWSENVSFSLTASEVDDRWSRVLADTGRVLNNYKVPNGASTTPNFLSCGMYGGCEYKNICFGDS